MNYLFSLSMNDWPPEHHLARSIVEIVEQLNLKAMERAYGTSGSAPPPRIVVVHIGLRLCHRRVFSRKLENTTYDSIAFRFVAADEHSDHDTL